MKIILSRKGLDTGSGKSPSPIIQSEKRMFSIPIPDDCETYYGYNDLRFSDDLSCCELMEQLNIKARNCRAHTDPDIRRYLYQADKTDPNWRPMFGQYSYPQGHLNKQRIGDGDIFLFFGLFKDIEKNNNGRYYFVPGTTKQVIWGYMQVDGKPRPVTDNACDYRHPHFLCYNEYKKYRNCSYENTVYFGRETLSEYPLLPGYGAFRFDNRLVLTENPGDKAEVYNVWKLPRHFAEHRMTYHPADRFSIINDEYCRVTAKNRGQEFVIDDEKATEWALDLIRTVHRE